MPGFTSPGAFGSPGGFGGDSIAPITPTAAKSFKKNSPGCGCCCSCCDQCAGDSPCTMYVNLGGNRYKLRKNKPAGSGSLFGSQDAFNYCTWYASGIGYSSGDCEIDNLWLFLQGPNASHTGYLWRLVAESTTGGSAVVGVWEKDAGANRPACDEPHTLTVEPQGADCDGKGNVVIEPDLIKAGCDPCCTDCAGQTPERWLVQIGGETFNLTERNFSGAYCYWQTSFAARGFGTDTGSNCTDYTGIQLYTSANTLYVTLTGGTESIIWSYLFSGDFDCENPQTLTLATSNTCGVPTSVTATPAVLNQCGSSGYVGPACDSGCCPEVSTQMDVDFTGASLVDGYCDQCNELAAVFTLPSVEPAYGVFAPTPPLMGSPQVRCTWMYLEQGLCSPAEEDGACAAGWTASCDYGLRVLLTLWQDGAAGQCGWTASMLLASYSEGPDDHATCNCGAIFGNYSSALFDVGSCSLPATLNRDSQSVSGVCSGNFPSTISIDAV